MHSFKNVLFIKCCRAVSGIYKKTLIINLPGSIKAAKECLLVIACAIPHAVTLIKDEKDTSKQFHDQLNLKNYTKLKVPVCKMFLFRILFILRQIIRILYLF